MSLGFATQSPNDGVLATKLPLVLVVPWTTGLNGHTERVNSKHCLPTDCPFDGVSTFSCNFFLVPAGHLYMVPSLPHFVAHNWCQTTDLANECCLPAAQHSSDNTRLALPFRSPLAMYCWHALGVANYFSLSSEIIAQALCIYQENRRGWEAKKRDIKIQMPSSVAWMKIILTSEVRRSPAGSGKSPPVNCCGLEWWMLVSTSEFQKNLSCRDTGHLGTRLNNSCLCFLSSSFCLVLFLLPQISQLRQQKIKPLWESLVVHNRGKSSEIP